MTDETRNELPEILDHHDGYGLNESIKISRDARDPKAGNGSHRYDFFIGEEYDNCGYLQFQHGPRGEAYSTPGLTEAAVIAALIDRLRAFQDGPYRCRENALVLTKLEEALHWARARADERAQRGVLGRNEP